MLSLSDEIRLTCCSHECTPQISRIYEKLSGTFKSPTPTTEQINWVLEAMELIAPLAENETKSLKSYHLFRIVIQAPASLAYSQEKWEASRFTRYGAYKWDEDLQDILAFLDHHFDLTIQAEKNKTGPFKTLG